MKCPTYCAAWAAALVLGTMTPAPCGECPQPAELLQQVRRWASAVEDPGQRASILHDVALVEAKAGNGKAAAATLEEAARVAAAISDPRAKRLLFVAIALAQANLGETAEALRTIGTIEPDGMRAGALCEMAPEMAAAGKIEAAGQIAAIIEDSFWKDATLGEIAVAQAELGKVDAALKTVAQIEADSSRTTTRLLIVLARAEAGDFPRALAIADTLASPMLKIRALAEIAVAQRRAGDQAAAAASDRRVLEIAGSIEEETPHGMIALAHARLGNDSAALEAARDDDAVLTKVALIQAERRDFDAAVQTAGLIGDAYQRDHALQQVATARAESGSIPAALEIAESIEDAYFGSVALRQIGLAQVARGDRASCRETLRRALYRLKGVEVGGGVKVLILQETGAALLKAGDVATATTAFQQASEAAANYQDEAYRAGLLQGIAKCQAEGGQASDALAWAAESPVPVVKARALLGVAEGLLARSKPQTE